MIFGYFLLSHLLGDFVFQTKRLVDWKKRSWIGIFVHASIHFIVSIIVFLPLILDHMDGFILPILFITFMHFWIDFGKLEFVARYKKNLFAFFADQIVHIVIILIASLVTIKNIHNPFPLSDFYGFYSNIYTPYIAAILLIIIRWAVYYAGSRDHRS